MEMITQIKQKVAFNNKIIKTINELQQLSLSRWLSKDERASIALEIEKLATSLESNDRIENSEILESMKKYDLDGAQLQSINVEYVLERCIVKGEITLIVAPPGHGKSSMALAIAHHCLSFYRIESVIYLDLDNSLVTLADRHLDKLKEFHQNKLKYIHNTTATKHDMQHLLIMMSNSVLHDSLIIFDSAKNFMGDGKDRDNNKDVSSFMQTVKYIRDSGATVIMLHHVNKPQKDVETIFAGAAAWMEDVSSLFMLKQNRYKNSFILTPHKERVGTLCEIAYIFDKSKNEITECDLFYAKETQEDEEIRNSIYEFIRNHISKPTYSEILEHCTQNCGYAKNKVNSVIQAAKEHYWKAIKEKENHNRDVYILLDRSDKLDSSKSILKDL